jgi:hypothetical protein
MHLCLRTAVGECGVHPSPARHTWHNLDSLRDMRRAPVARQRHSRELPLMVCSPHAVAPVAMHGPYIGSQSPPAEGSQPRNRGARAFSAYPPPAGIKKGRRTSLERENPPALISARWLFGCKYYIRYYLLCQQIALPPCAIPAQSRTRTGTPAGRGNRLPAASAAYTGRVRPG